MAIGLGSRVGPYEVTARLGEGGMGEVYRATDTNLGRQVAIKVLPEAFAQDPERLARFEREAKTLASLNHPNIAAIYGLERSGTMPALVMELVEGPTLADRIAQGPVPVDEALPIAKQIAEAFEAAHEQGVIHRDLKPANIKLRPDGVVKVLDFGLAKLIEQGSGIGDQGSGAAGDDVATYSPTLSVAATRAGVILGTAAYMSPEQARGKTVDRRTDIWAFGCVLFEALTAQRTFRGADITDTIAAVVRTEPAWSALPVDTPVALRRLLVRCLKKDPKERLQAIGDARIDIGELLSGTSEAAMSTAAGAQGLAEPALQPALFRRALPWAAAALCLAAGLAVLSIVHFGETPAALSPEIRTEIVTPATTDATSFALSPDGRHLVFVASGDGPSRLWVRALSATVAQPLAGTEGAASPFWSPDSRSIGFFADGKLKRLDLGDGTPRELANTSFSRGGTWNADGVILFAPDFTGPLFRVAASGGGAVPVTKLDRQTNHRWPQFLPDGRQFLFYASGPPETAGIYWGALDSGDTIRLTIADTAGLYAPSGWLFWVRAGALVAQRLDLERRALAGDPVTVADAVGFTGAANAGAFSISTTGPVAYRAGEANRAQLQWFDRSGTMSGSLGAPLPAGTLTPRLSPDGRRAAVWRIVQGNADIWVLDGIRESRLTFDAARDVYPQWSPDGSRIVFDSNRRGRRNLYAGAVGNPGSETLLLESSQDNIAFDWSPDGRFLLYAASETNNVDLWVLPLAGDRKPFVFLKTNFQERSAHFSPDGRWVAYVSDESGRHEVYVRPFVPLESPAGVERTPANPGGGQWQVSTAGGIYPRWSPGGRELYYLGPNGQMMAAPIKVAGATLEPGTPVRLFQTRIAGGGTESGQGRQYDVARDGRFLINRLLDDAAAPITILQNWSPERR